MDTKDTDIHLMASLPGQSR